MTEDVNPILGVHGKIIRDSVGDLDLYLLVSFEVVANYLIKALDGWGIGPFVCHAKVRRRGFS